MWINYLKMAWRSLVGQRAYGALNVGGLAVGMACCLLIGAYVLHEHSYDAFHEGIDTHTNAEERSKCSYNT